MTKKIYFENDKNNFSETSIISETKQNNAMYFFKIFFHWRKNDERTQTPNFFSSTVIRLSLY